MSRKYHVPARTLRLLGAALVVALTSGYVAIRAEAAPPAPPTLSWSAAPLAPTATPPALAYASAAYDADNSTIVLFGGVSSSGGLNDTTWVWQGHSWTPIRGTTEPPARELASMAFDPAQHQLVLFGGEAADGTLLSDTWAWNGVTWHQIQTVGSGPPAREAASMAYDGQGNLVLFGGTGYAPVSSSTTSSPPTTAGGSTTAATAVSGPATAAGVPTAADPALETLGDTWLWNGSAWVASAAPGPSPRSGAALITDTGRGDAVLFGGQSTIAPLGPGGLLSDTWIWNGSGWARAHATASPPPRIETASDFDSAAGSPLLVGGVGAGGDLADAWVWWGAGWVPANLEGAPPGRQGAASAYDAATGDMVIFGGTVGGAGALGDTDLISTVPPSVNVATTSTVTTSAPGQTATTVHHRTYVIPRASTTLPKEPSTSHVTHPGLSTAVPTTAVAGPPGPTLQALPDRLRPASEVWLSGRGFTPGVVVKLEFHSTPTVVGEVTVGADGTFLTPVTVPPSAASGVHHFSAYQLSPAGPVTVNSPTVTVVVPSHGGIPLSTTLTMVGLALAIPLAAYYGLALPGALRRRRPSAGA
jgi:Galactose oxidase, central domain